MLIVMGEAMQAYASFEFWLFNLVDVLLKTRRESAAALFYSIKNNRDRNAGVTALVRSVTGDRYVTFWNSIRKHIQQMDEMRNRLAHGLVILDVGKCSSKAPNPETGRLWIEEGPEVPYLTREDVISSLEKPVDLVCFCRLPRKRMPSASQLPKAGATATFPKSAA